MQNKVSFGQHGQERVMTESARSARIVASGGSLLLGAVPRKNRRIQIQTITLFQWRKPTDEPAPHRPPETFDLGLAETTEVIQNRVVTRKALHAQQCVQGAIRP